MKRILWVALMVAAGCASSQGGGATRAQAAAGTGAAHEPPVVMYRVLGRNTANPVIRIPYDTARKMGVAEPTFASPAMIDQLEASCGQSTQPVECRRELQDCYTKTCRIVPVY